MLFYERQFNDDYVAVVVGRHFKGDEKFTQDELDDMGMFFDVFKTSSEVFDVLNRPVSEKVIVEDIVKMLESDIQILANTDGVAWANKILGNEAAHEQFKKAWVHLLTGINVVTAI